MPRIIVHTLSAVLLLSVLILSGCATPVGVNVVSSRDSYLAANANPLGAGVISDPARSVLNRYFLLKKYDSDPAAAIAELHEKALSDDRRDLLYALAETSYLYGSKLADSDGPDNSKQAQDYFLLSALYAYFYALEERSTLPASPFDSRTRNAMDIYNYGLWQGLPSGEGGRLVLEGQTRKLPFGNLTISLDTTQFPWKIEEFEKFLPADKYEVRGVSVRNRTPGAGLPLIGIKKGALAQALPVTAFLRIQGDLVALNAGTARASLELYSALDSSTLNVNNRIVPLETDTTTPMAYRLEGSEYFNLNLGSFLGREANKIPDGLYLKESYRPGRIPIVLVHGTASSPVWWAEMLNTLTADKKIRENYQFWYFVYTSSKPVAISAADLRDALREKVAALDPQGQDPALQQMVVIGHSQGGLLTKFTVVDTGDSLVRAVTGKDFDSLEMPEKTKAMFGRALVVKPLPFVKTVIFMSTPHRGSFLSKEWNRNILKWLVTLPVNIVETSMDAFDHMNDDTKKLLGGKKTFFTSADGMSAKNPVLKALADIPLAPGVQGHSIIAVQTEGDQKLGNDGVVEYTSAHLNGMASEFVVRSDHSSQLNPLAIDEVRRILVKNVPESSLVVKNQK